MPDQSTYPRRWRRLALAATFAVAAVLGSLAISSPASADTVSKCDSSLSSGNVNTCVKLSLSGNLLTVDGWAKVINQGRTIQVCLTPAFQKPNCSRFLTEMLGQTIFAPSQNASGPNGPPNVNYCANTYRLNADGTHAHIGQVCLPLSAAQR